MKLTDALDAAAAGVDNLCVVNATLLLCMPAERHGDMAGFIRRKKYIIWSHSDMSPQRGAEEKRHLHQRMLGMRTRPYSTTVATRWHVSSWS